MSVLAKLFAVFHLSSCQTLLELDPNSSVTSLCDRFKLLATTSIMFTTLPLLLALASLPIITIAHSPFRFAQDNQIPLDAEWSLQHMISEHHISNFDPLSFFKMHDFDSDGLWEGTEIRRTYGLEDVSNKDVSEEKKQEVVTKVLEMFDTDGNGYIESREWMDGIRNGKKLQDYGYGPGHHGDAEQEYELHHWQQYHADGHDSPEDMIHPEDIEHYAQHDKLEDEADRQAELDRRPIVSENIPAKFRRNG